MLKAFSAASPTNPYEQKILVVDDHPATRDMIIEALRQSGYLCVHEAKNGFDALEILQKESHDLVISDVMMPGMNGIDLLHRIRELDPDAAIIMMTVQPATDLTVYAMKTGAIDFIQKPFNINDLLYKVQIYLREKSLADSEERKNKSLHHHLTDQTKDLSIKSYIYESLENLEGDNDEIFEKLAEIAMHITNVDTCSIMIYDNDSDDFYPKVFKSTDNRIFDKEDHRTLKPFFTQAIEKKEALVIHSESHPAVSPSTICVPLTIRGQAFGVLSVRKKKNSAVFNTKDLNYLTSLAKRASLNLENKLLYESLYANVLDTFRSLIASIELRDHYTEKHSMRVTKNALRVAHSMGCSEKEIEILKVAGPLHDLGKIAIPDNILLKPGRLTDEEYTIIKTHSEIGAKIMSSIALFDTEREIVLHHHERWDGRGYPSGLRGDEIPLLSRILAVADTYDAITNNRPYRDAQDMAWAIEQLEKNRFTQFDGHVVDHFLKILHEE